MTTGQAPVRRPSPDDPDGGSDVLHREVRHRFDRVAASKTPLFLVDAADLPAIWLDALPVELQQHYRCRSCARFFARYGGLVTVDPTGRLRSALWSELGDVPVAFAEAVSRLRRRVEESTISEVFVSSDHELGTGSNVDTTNGNVWTHFSLAWPEARRHRTTALSKSVEARSAELREEHAMLARAVSEFKPEAVRTALQLFGSGAFDRPEKGEPLAKWFLALLERLPKNPTPAYNLLWIEAATAPTGFCHVRSGMVGTLLQDVVAGVDAASCARRWNEKVDPAKYMRAQVAPSAGNLRRAETIAGEMAAAGSLRRRYAVRSDVVETLWSRRRSDDVATAASALPVFGHLKAKAAPETQPKIDLPGEQRMTWDKFSRTLLVDAARVEYYVPAKPQQLGALVTAADPTSPPILQWDLLAARNPMSVYSATSEPTKWMLAPGYVDVEFAARMPYHWNGAASPQHKEGVLLALRGCVDVARKKGGGFLPEFLRGELREVRASLDAYAREAVVEGRDVAECCGLVLMKTSDVAAAATSSQSSATRVVVVLDESGSMSQHSQSMRRQGVAIADVLHRQLPTATVEVCRFGTELSWEPPKVGAKVELPAGGSGRGSTALYAALERASQRAEASSQPTLVYLLTDGENQSYASSEGAAASAVTAAMSTGRVSFACVGPSTAARFFAGCGIPSRCVRSWDVHDARDLDAVTAQVAAGLSAFADARGRGVAAVEDFFSAPVSGFGDGVKLRVTTKDGCRRVVVLDRWD